MLAGEIYLAAFPLGGTVGVKLRPVLLLTDLVGPVPEVLVGYISSKIPAALLPSDIILDPNDAKFASTQLKQKSILRLHKLSTIHQTDLRRYLGKIDSAVHQEVCDRLKTLLGI